MNQHQKPCSECPFSRSVIPGALGGSDACVYVGQIHGPFFLHCHMCVDHTDPNWKADISTSQCAGAAIFRANLGLQPAGLLSLPVDTKVFASAAEFLAHHYKISVEAAISFLTIYTPEDMMMRQISRSTTKLHVIPKKE